MFLRFCSVRAAVTATGGPAVARAASISVSSSPHATIRAGVSCVNASYAKAGIFPLHPVGIPTFTPTSVPRTSRIHSMVCLEWTTLKTRCAPPCHHTRQRAEFLRPLYTLSALRGFRGLLGGQRLGTRMEGQLLRSTAATQESAPGRSSEEARNGSGRRWASRGITYRSTGAPRYISIPPLMLS